MYIFEHVASKSNEYQRTGYIYETMSRLHILGRILMNENLLWDEKSRKFIRNTGIKAIIPQLTLGIFYCALLVESFTSTVQTMKSKGFSYILLVYALESVFVICLFWALVIWTYYSQEKCVRFYRDVDGVDKMLEKFGIDLSSRNDDQRVNYAIIVTITILCITVIPATYFCGTLVIRKSLLLKYPLALQILYRMVNMALGIFFLKDRLHVINGILERIVCPSKKQLE